MDENQKLKKKKIQLKISGKTASEMIIVLWKMEIMLL